jgi:serine/threonine-protein kinase
MASEQVRGKPIDKRVDVWAFGCVLYECLTARRAWGGESLSDVLAAVLEREPDWTALPSLPPPVEALLRRCLDKDARTRLRDVGEARVCLSDPLDGGAPQTPGTARPSWIFLWAVTLLFGAVSTWFALRHERVDTRERVQLTIPSTTDAYSGASSPLISPDGKSVLFGATDRADGVARLWLRSLASFEARPIPETEGAHSPFWSPDSASIGFFANGFLQTLRLGDGAAQNLTEGENHDGAGWSSRGVIVYSQPESGLWSVSDSGGEPSRITEHDPELGEIGHYQPRFLPDGDRFFFLGPVRTPEVDRLSHRLYVGSLSTGETTFLSVFPSVVWPTERGELVFVEDGSIRSAPFDSESLEITGDVRVIAGGVAYSKVTGRARLSVARDGTLAFQGPQTGDELVWLDHDGIELGRVGGVGMYLFPHRISPDGRSLAIGISDPRTWLSDVWILGLARETRRRVTSGFFWEGIPSWSADGSELFYSTDLSGWPGIEAIAVDPLGVPRPVWDREREQFAIDATDDGRILFASSAGDELWRLPLDGHGDGADAPVRIATGIRGPDQGIGGPRLSPDERWIAYGSNASGDSQVYILELEGSRRTIQVTVDGGRSPVWDPRGGKLYYIASSCDQMWEVELATDEQRAQSEPRILFETGTTFTHFDIAPDGERFLVRYTRRSPPPISIVLRGNE